MSRRRAVSSVQHAEQLADDVLAGRTQLPAGELLDCIHAINPTGRGLTTGVERRRYQIKARLQSLLIRAYDDDLAVTIDDHGVVAIRHRYLGKDACHVKIDDLDPDARARVRWRLDVGDGGASAGAQVASAAAARAPGVEDPVARGRAALAEFDYDTARALLEPAVRDAGDDATAARALLELLVDHLALDEDAIAIAPVLSPAVAADGDVQALLAMAAARLGDAATAERLLDGLHGARSADAWAALAHDAIRRAALDDLERYVARLTEVDPARADLVELRHAADRLRAEARRPAEEALLRAAERDDEPAVEAMARALLVRWPDSSIAGKLVRRIQDRQRTSEIDRLLDHARGAVAAGDLARARERVRQAAALGANVQALSDQIREAGAAQRRVADEAAVDEATARLADADPRPGLAAFLALPPELRRRVRDRTAAVRPLGAAAGGQPPSRVAPADRVASPMLDWLEQAVAHHRAAQPGDLIEAVLAIASADDAIAHGDSEQALALLDRGGELLAGVARAGELRAEALRRIAVGRRTAATAGLSDAQRALAEGDLERCAQICEHIDRRDLDLESRDKLDELRAELRRRRDAGRQRTRIDQLAASGDLVSARRELAQLLAAPGVLDQDTVALRGRLGELGAELRRSWEIRADEPDDIRDDHDRIGELLGQLPYVSTIAPWLVNGGRELLLASVEGAYVFVARVAVGDGRLLDRRWLRAPAALGRLSTMTVDGDTLWLIDDGGRVLQLTWATGQPLRWASLTGFLGDGERIEREFLLPGGAHLWLEAGVPGGIPAFRVIEIGSWRSRREFPPSRNLQPLVSGTASCVIGVGHGRGAVRYTDRGTMAEDLAGCGGIHISDVQLDPEGRLVVLGTRDQEHDELEVTLIKDGHTLDRLTLADSVYELVNHVASSRASGVVAIYHLLPDRDARLEALHTSDAGFAQAYSVPAPRSIVLTQDVDANHLVALWDSPRGVELTPITATPPALGPTAHDERWRIPVMADYFSCAPHGRDDDGAGLLYDADAAARRGDWATVRATLEPTLLDQVAPVWVAHHCHLLGLAWLRTGEPPDRVHTLWETGRSQEDTSRILGCHLDICIDLVAPLPVPLPADWWGSDVPLVRQLRGAIATADDQMAAGDPRAALQALRRRAVTQASELQSTARLAAAWLAIDAAPRYAVFDKAIALARFVALATRTHVADLPIEAAWSRDRLTAVADQAQHWLAEPGVE